MQADKVINLWVSDVDSASRQAFPMPGLGVKGAETTSAELSASINGFLDRFAPVLEALPRDIGGYSVDELELSLAINSSGGVELIGKLSAGVQASIKVKLSRAKP